MDTLTFDVCVGACWSAKQCKLKTYLSNRSGIGNSCWFIQKMALILYCCEMRKKLRFLLYSVLLLVIASIFLCCYFVNVIIGLSICIPLLLTIIVICFYEIGIAKCEPKYLKIALIFKICLLVLHIVYVILLFITASKGIWSEKRRDKKLWSFYFNTFHRVWIVFFKNIHSSHKPFLFQYFNSML